MAELKDLHQRRGVVKRALTRFKSFLEQQKGCEEVNVSLIKVRLEKSELLWDEFSRLQIQIEMLNPESQDELNCRDEFEDQFCICVSEARLMIEQNVHDVHEKSGVNAGKGDRRVIELPRIELPIFDGKWEDFRFFKEEFHSLIGSRNDLDQTQKFRYLMRALKGDAAVVIRSMEVSGANYALAWEALNERFENKRRIVYKHLKAICDGEKLERASPVKFQNMLDTVYSNLRSLKSLGLPTDQWDAILVYTLSEKLDSQTRQKWQEKGSKDEIPTLDQFKQFIQQRIDMLETEDDYKCSKSGIPSKPLSSRVKSLYASKVSSNYYANCECKYCGRNHPIFVCRLFRGLSVETRLQEAKKLKLCQRCLNKHSEDVKCNFNCKRCCKPHNTLLHKEADQTESAELRKSNTPDRKEQRASNSATSCQTRTSVLLSTAVVHVIGERGDMMEARVLLDSGSQSNFISSEMARKLGGEAKINNTIVSGIGGTKSTPLKIIRCIVKSRYEPLQFELEFLVLPKVTLPLPEAQIDYTNWKMPKDLFLADPEFDKPAPIDLLIGAEQYFSLMKCHQMSLGPDRPRLQHSSLGWILGGKFKEKLNKNIPTNIVGCSHLSLEESLRKFWEIEEVRGQLVLSAEEKECEKIFNETTTRCKAGKFVVKLPTKHSISKLGDSADNAKGRFLDLERKLSYNPTLKNAYILFMEEYKALGHMALASESQLDSTGYYLPHHGVHNQHSSTTKLRVVFDASAKTSSGISLNDLLMTGPCIQQDLFSILIRFRLPRYVLTSDISKMYRQIWIAEPDQNLQLIYWRKDTSEPLKTYCLKTVTYGTSPASFLATRCLKQLAVEHQFFAPEAARTIQEDFYMDDLLTGSDSLEELVRLKQEVTTILSSAGLELHKWCANDSRILQDIPVNKWESKYVPERNTAVKTLGMWWRPDQDDFNFSITMPEGVTWTKRVALSEIARIFDPLGLLGPIIVKGKIFLQKLWEGKLDWDDPLPKGLLDRWLNLRQELNDSKQFAIPRSIRNQWEGDLQLHGFCDASEEAYGAAVYVRTAGRDGMITTRLLCSKSRVSPLKRMTLPRLELCGALLLAKLVDKIRKTSRMVLARHVLWSDSTIALAWIASPSSRWRTFVANRVSEIQELTVGCQWRHVRSEDNPADKVSRGLAVGQLVEDKMWWHGPPWLSQESSNWPGEQPTIVTKEERKITALLTVRIERIFDWNRYSSFPRIIRIIVHLLKFIKKCHKQEAAAFISSQDWYKAEKICIKHIQAECFAEDIGNLEGNGVVSPKSKLLTLNPFLDQDKILRVGGRIGKAPIPYNQRHPMLLPRGHHVSLLIARWEHVRQLHAGPNLLLASMRQRFWPLGGRDLVRRVWKECMICFKVKPKGVQQMMGELPLERLTAERPFLNTGVDFCGPLMVKASTLRRAKVQKAYVAIFVCLSVKALHIELVGDLSTPSFLGALKRFFARRGKARVIMSDNGTNFAGAKNELKYAFCRAMKDPDVTNYLANENVEWRFIPPQAPEFGGLWEAAVKSFKFHLRRIVGERSLTYEEMTTYLALIESVLNSRPLLPLSPSPDELASLTPGHFLIGDTLTAIPEGDIQVRRQHTLSRWHMVEQMFQNFWARWSKEYLATLQTRAKLLKRKQNICTGQLVLIKDERTPPLKWPLARVWATHPGADGLVRVVTVKTWNGL